MPSNIAKFHLYTIWLLQLVLVKLLSNSSSLLANSAKSALILAKQSANLQEVAHSFAKHLDITYKIWLELNDYKKDSSIINKPDTLMNAVYLDTVMNENLDNTAAAETVMRGSRCLTMEQRVALNITERSRTDSADQRVINECKNLFHNHLTVAMETLSLLQNPYSESEAIKSLTSILNIMQSTYE